MDTTTRAGRIRRRMLASMTLAAVATAMLSTVSPTAHADPTCRVTNQRTHVQGSDLQQAIDDATSGDTISVGGTCFGGFIIDAKNLTLRGVSTPTREKATLDGSNTQTVLQAYDQAVVTIKDLLITHGLGSFDSGGGIIIGGASVILNGSTKVVRNTASRLGGGIYITGGSLTLNGSARVNLNESLGSGGGIATGFQDSFVIMNKTSRVNRNKAADSGGGVFLCCTNDSLTMNDAATITGNTAGSSGGGVFANGQGTTTGATAGGNVRNNTPDDISP